MAKPLAIFPDPVIVTLRVLRGAFLAHAEVAASAATVSNVMPERDAYTATPALLVVDDGDAGSGVWPVSDDALMRITVWDNDPVRAARLANIARAYLLADPGAADSRGFTSASRPLLSTDPDDATPLASFTITARLRAQ